MALLALYVGFPISLSLIAAPCGAANVEMVIDSGHSGAVWALSISPDGKTIVSGSNDGTKLWDLATGWEIRSLKDDTGAVRGIAFSPDGKSLGVSGDGGFSLYDFGSGMKTKSVSADALSTGSGAQSLAFVAAGRKIVLGSFVDAQIIDLSTGAIVHHEDQTNAESEVSPDGSLLASWEPASVGTIGPNGDQDKAATQAQPTPVRKTTNEIIISDLLSSKIRYTLSGHTAKVATVAFSGSGKKLASTDLDGNIIVWDLGSGRELRRLKGARFVVAQRLAFSPDERSLAWGRPDGGITLFDLDSGREQASDGGHTGGVCSMVFSTDGKTIVSGGGDKAIRIWDASNLRTVRILSGHSHSISKISFTPDDKGLNLLSYATDMTVSTIRKCDFANARSDVIAETEDCVTMLPGKNSIIATSKDRYNAIFLWDISAGKELREIKTSDRVRSVQMSPDGRWIVAVLGHLDLGGKTMRNISKIAVWDLQSSEKETEVCHFDDEYTTRALSLAISPDSAILAVSNYYDSGLVTLWDLAAARAVRTLKFGGDIEFSPDGKLLAAIPRVTSSGPIERGVQIWDLATGGPLHSFPAPKSTNGSRSVAFSRDMKSIAIDEDSVITIWEMGTWRELAKLQGPPGNEFDFDFAMDFTNDGRVVAAANASGLIKLWRTSDWHELCSILPLDQNDWVIMDPQGRFDASPGAMELIHGREGDQLIDLRQMKERFYDPKLLAKLLGFCEEPLRTVAR